MAKWIKKEELVNTETGEVVEAVTFIPEVQDKNFAKVFQTYSKKFLEDMGIINGESKLFMWFLAKTIENEFQGDGWIYISYKEIAKDFEVHIVTIKNYIKRLKKLGYIQQIEKNKTVFRINPDFVYKGYLWKHKKETIDKHIEKIKNKKVVNE